MLFKGRCKIQDYFRYFLQLFSVPSFIFSINGKGLILTRQQMLDSSKLKEFADNNFKFDENGRKLSKPVENTVGQGEIARNEPFENTVEKEKLLVTSNFSFLVMSNFSFSQCFQKAYFPGVLKGVIEWEWVNSFPNDTF